MKTQRCLISCAMALCFLVLPAWSEDGRQNRSTEPTHSASSYSPSGDRSWGVRVGMTDGVDQVVGGVHVNLGEVSRRVRFQPDLELGAGDDATTVYGTAPLYYRFRTHTRMTPYAGGGLALGYVDVDLPPTASGDDSGFEVGARATGGLEWPRQDGAFFVELSLGFGDIHDARVVAAWTF